MGGIATTATRGSLLSNSSFVQAATPAHKPLFLGVRCDCYCKTSILQGSGPERRKLAVDKFALEQNAFCTGGIKNRRTLALDHRSSAVPMESVEQLQSRITRDLTGAWTASAAYIADKIGLFKLLTSSSHPLTSAQISEKLSLNHRYIAELLNALYAAQYIRAFRAPDVEIPVTEIDSEAANATGTEGKWVGPDYQSSIQYEMTEAQKQVLGREEDTAFVASYFQFTLAHFQNVDDVVTKGFQEGSGVSFTELGDEVPHAMERMHGPYFRCTLGSQLYNSSATQRVLSSNGMSSLRILDVGCGTGVSTVALSRAFAGAQVVGLDADSRSVEAAVKQANGVQNVSFVCSTIEDFSPSERYHIALCYDTIHDMKDPVKSLQSIRKVMHPNGLVIWGDPAGFTDPLQNIQERSQMRLGISLLHCMTVSLEQGGAGLGTLVGDERAKCLARAAGYEHFEKLDISSATQAFYGLSPLSLPPQQ